MSVTWQEAEFRGRDLALTALIVVALSVLAWWNAWRAAAVAHRTSPRLRICAVAARPLDAGTVLRDEDVVIRVRRVTPEAEFFDRTSQLVGRQLATSVDRSQVLQKAMLVGSCLEASVTFFIVADGQSASGITTDDRVILTRAGKHDSIPTLPIFTVVNTTEIEPILDGKKVKDRRLELVADYATDAMRVLAAADDASKFIPLRMERPAYIGGDVKPPVPIHKVAPRYPGRDGTCPIGLLTVKGVVTREGVLRAVHIVKGEEDVYTRAVIDAFYEWKFKPATRHGKPVEVYIYFTARNIPHVPPPDTRPPATPT